MRDYRDTGPTAVHPAVRAAYFAMVLLCTMVLMHPAALLISLLGALTWLGRLGGGRALGRTAAFLLPLLAFTALLTPVFSHQGATILAWLPWGNPLTLESILYGVAAALMLAAALCWFSCINRVMTADQFIYLFGRAAPGLSLLLSMTLRLVPRLGAQLREIRRAQKALGRDPGVGSLAARGRQGARMLSMVVGWSLENAVDTADAMKARGYGLQGRTTYSLYRWTARDREALAALLALGGYVAAMGAAGGFACRYYPTLKLAPWDAFTVSGLMAYALLCALPVLCHRPDAPQKENRP